MTIRITEFRSQVMNTGKVREFSSLEELSNLFKECNAGDKLGSGFSRCEIEGKRSNKNCKNSKLLIIDADKPRKGDVLPPPVDCHKALIGLGYNHFIYTSFSHTSEVPKYRVVVECEEYSRETLDDLNLKLLDAIDSKQISIAYVKEMKAFSQIWFYPRRKNPNDGLYEFYSYFDGKAFSCDYVTKKEREAERKNEERAAGTHTIDQMMENIRTGAEYHESLLILSYQLIKDGLPKAFVKSQLRMYMNNSIQAGTDRWVQRYNEIDRMVDNCIEEDNSSFDFFFEGNDDIEYESKAGLPLPPGLMGKLYKNAYDFLMLQYPQVALSASIGLISGICGRRFNVAEPIPSGLNMFLTIIAATGSGKDRINDFITNAIRGNLKDYSGFIGPSHFYSPKAVVNSFKDNRSRVCVVSEAGLLMKVKSGNVDGLSAFILDAFQCSHSNGYTKAHSYSSLENSMEGLRAMAMTVISESSPEKMLEAYGESGALESGLLPRQLLFKIDRRETHPNRAIRTDLDLDVRLRISELLDFCLEVQNQSDPKVSIVRFESQELLDSVYNYMVKYNQISADNEGKNVVRQHMATRVAQKAIRLSAICAVFNSNSLDNIVIGEKEWNWGVQLCDYEYENISNALKGASKSNAANESEEEWDEAVKAVLGKLSQILNGSIRNSQCQIDKKYRERKIVPYGYMKVCLNRNKYVNVFNDGKSGNGLYGNGKGFMSGLDKVLESMAKVGCIEILKKCPLGGKFDRVIVVKESIKAYSQMFL